jgi:hypothetical protein
MQKTANPRLLITTALFVASAAITFSVSRSDADSEYQPPRTEHGYPDLQGMWSNASITRLTRPRGAETLSVSPEQAVQLEASNIWNQLGASQEGQLVDVDAVPEAGDRAAAFSTRGYNYFWIDPGTRLATVKGEIRTSWIVDPADGQIPYLPGAQQRQRNPEGIPRIGSFDGPETRPPAERCLTSFSNAGGPVMLNGMYNNTYQIVQTQDHVMILVEMVNDARIIPIGKPLAEDPHPRWLGNSVGWYEGDTLVVETIMPHPMQRAMISPAGKLTERFSRWSDEQIVYEFEVEDPSLYSQIWRGEMSFNQSTEPLYEYACHEGNHALPGILAGARVQEAAGGVVEHNADVEN